MTDTLNEQKSIGKNLLLPILIWAGIIVVFLNVKHIPYDFSEKEALVVRYLVKVIFTVTLPLLFIHLLYKEKSDFGIYLPKLTDSLKLTFRSFGVVGPAGMTFLLIGTLGLTFADWGGSFILTAVYLLVLYFIPKITKSLPTRDHLKTHNNKMSTFAVLGMLTVIVTYATVDWVPQISKAMYYLFIVGLGEELLFRGYMQSAFNRYFGKPFRIGNVSFGWGLILAAILFGLMHALVVSPPLWPWALFTFALGLTFGFIREKDGSILAPVLLHGLSDMPLVFFSV